VGLTWRNGWSNILSSHGLKVGRGADGDDLSAETAASFTARLNKPLLT
jgi:hypothetical protein